MRKVVVIGLTIFLLTGCKDRDNSNRVHEMEVRDNNQESIVQSKEKSNEEINDTINITENVISSIEIENLLRQEVKELKPLEDYIYQKSKENAFMLIESDGVLRKIDFKGSEDEYFMVYVGEKYKDHKVNWCWFYVSKNLDEILFYDVIESEVFTLLEWRETDLYREKFGFISD